MKQGNKQTLWVVTELYYPEETSTGYYLTRIAEGLVDNFQVKVICGQPNYSAKGIVAKKKERHKQVDIFRVWGTRLDKNVILYRIINMVSLGFSMFIRSLFYLQKGDKVLVVTTPPILPFLMAIASLIKGAGYILLIHDNYPEILIAAEKTRENSFFVKVLEILNRWLYKFSSKIIVVGRDMRELLLEKTRGLDVPVDVIPNWGETEQVYPTERRENKLLQELNLTDKLVFLYAGNMGYPNDLKTIVWCARKLLFEKKFDIQFIFLGSGVKKKWLNEKVREQNLENITMLEPRPRSDQIVFLNACDVGIVSLVKNMRGVSMPSRTYNILAAGKPILAITDENSELAKVLEEDSVGWFVSPGDKKQLYSKILEIYDQRNSLEKFIDKSRKTAIDKYSLETALDKYRKSLNFNASDNN